MCSVWRAIERLTLARSIALAQLLQCGLKFDEIAAPTFFE